MEDSKLHIAGGTLRIRLTADSADDLIADRELMIELCPVLAPILRHPGEADYRAAWDKSVLVKVEGAEDGKEIRMTTLALNPVDQTFLLESKDFISEPTFAFYTFFMESELASHEWSVIFPFLSDDYKAARDNAIRSHIVLLDLLHGRSSPQEDCPDLHEDADVCALAEYYGCLPAICQAMYKKLTSNAKFWDRISDNPLAYLRLAVVLECKELYLDAWRHVMGSASHIPKDEQRENYQQELVSHFGAALSKDPPASVRKGEKAIQELLSNLQREQEQTIIHLNRSLRKLQLSETYTKSYGDTHYIRTSFFNLLQHPWTSSKPELSSLYTSRFLAGAIYGNWLTQQELGDHLYGSMPQRKSRPAGPFNVAVAKLEKYASSPYPVGVFGYKAPQEVLSMLGLESNSRPTKEVCAELKQLVLAAGTLIKEAFKSRDVTLENGTVVTYRRAHCDGGEAGYFTYFPCDENDFPWDSAEKLAQFWDFAVDMKEEARERRVSERQNWEYYNAEMEKEEQERERRLLG